MKKATALVLAIILFCGLLPLGARAEGEGRLAFLYVHLTEIEDSLDELNNTPGFVDWGDFYIYTTDKSEATLLPRTVPVYFVPDGGCLSEAICITPITFNGQPCREVAYRNFGSGTLVATVSDVTYSMPVSAALPTSGFSKTPELTEESYITSINYTASKNKFYYVFEDDFVTDTNNPLAFSNESLDILAQWSPDGKCAEFTINKVADGEWLSFGIKLPDGTIEWIAGITIYDGGARLVYDFGNETTTNGIGRYSIPVNTTQSIALYTVEEGAEIGYKLPFGTDVRFEPDEGTEADAITVKRGFVNATFGYEIQAHKIGSGFLVAEVNGDEYAMGISAALPQLGFFTRQEYSFEANISTFQYNVAEPENNTVWLMCENGFTLEQAQEATFRFSSRTSLKELQSPITTEIVNRNGISDRYDIKISIKKCERFGINITAEVDIGSYWAIVSTLTVDNEPYPYEIGNAAYSVKDGQLYVVGFGHYWQEGILSISEGNSGRGKFYDRVSDDYIFYDDLNIYAASRIEAEGTVVFTEVNEDVLAYTISKVWLEPLMDDIPNGSTFSFSQDESILELTGEEAKSPVSIFAKDGYDASYNICAEILFAGEEPQRISMQLTSSRSSRITFEIPESANTIEEINECLNELANIINNDGESGDFFDGMTTYFVRIPAGDFDGTLVVPHINRAYALDISGVYSWDGTSTEISTTVGGIDLSGSIISSITGISFVAGNEKNNGDISSGLFNSNVGSLSLCSFEKFDAAIDMSKAGTVQQINECTFTGNEVAISIDLYGSPMGGSAYGFWGNNTFIGNRVAFQAISTSPYISPFYYRMFDSTFLGNETDFDVRAPGTFYCYRNYYGKENGEYRSAIISAQNGSRVASNPRRMEQFSNQLGIDGSVAEILNEEADMLKLPSDRLNGKEIILKDEKEQTLGAWSFPETAESYAKFSTFNVSEDFNAKLDINADTVGQISVAVEDNTLLAAKTPTLTIPCGFGSAVVMHEGNKVASTISGGEISFQVVEGGTYTIYNNLDVNISAISADNRTYTLNVEVNKNDITQGSTSCVLAAYSQTGQMLGVVTNNIVWQGNKHAATVNLSIPSGYGGTVTIKAILLDTNNAPLASALVQ